ncbi:hypothetical protein SFRURICE_011118 [Spodoptera frugiperda]|nr:hypothetical protein SFRURICE_011118 [Spodoptera frugiperda]
MLNKPIMRIIVCNKPTEVYLQSNIARDIGAAGMRAHRLMSRDGQRRRRRQVAGAQRVRRRQQLGVVALRGRHVGSLQPGYRHQHRVRWRRRQPW